MLTLSAHQPGVGCQFLAVAVGIIGMALMGMFNVHRHGSMNSAAIFLYALASTIAGYVSVSYYRMMGGTRWVSNVNLTTILFAGVCLCILHYLLIYLFILISAPSPLVVQAILL